MKEPNERRSGASERPSSPSNPADSDASPAFTLPEMPQRRHILLAAAAEQDADRVLSVGVQHFGSAIRWLTG